MTKWIFEVNFPNSSRASYKVTVEHDYQTEARELCASREGVSLDNIVNCGSEVEPLFGNSSSSSSGSSKISMYAIGALLVIGVIALFAEWFLMIGGGIGGAFLSQKIIGYKVKDYFSKDSLSSKDVKSSDKKKLLIIIISSIVCGGIGFGAGSQFKKEYMEETPRTDETNQIQEDIFSEPITESTRTY